MPEGGKRSEVSADANNSAVGACPQGAGPVPLVLLGAVPRALRVPAAPQRRPPALAAVPPGPRLLLAPVQRHRGADG